MVDYPCDLCNFGRTRRELSTSSPPFSAKRVQSLVRFSVYVLPRRGAWLGCVAPLFERAVADLRLLFVGVAVALAGLPFVAAEPSVAAAQPSPAVASAVTFAPTVEN